ncbi:MAG: Gfo/Idh/MocA family oxidoreductase [Planctomycetes bacterium]|nr:Gfo/Idh/MocA family oxidoreductase [Planctomycetota bacterium]
MSGRRHRIGRRTFLRRAAMGLGAVALPRAVSAHALAGEGRLAPSDRIGIAFIGPGHRGTQLVHEFAERSDVEPIAVCDVIADRRIRVKNLIEEYAAKRRGGAPFKGCRTFIDFREVLALPDVDGVVLSAPEHWRGILCILAAEAGKDVFTEKPFALTIHEGRAMVDAVRRHGRIFQHGTQRRSNNEAKLRDSCEMVRSGRIGEVTHAIVSVGPVSRSDFPAYAARPDPPDREVFDWDLWLGPAPWRPYPGPRGIPGWQGRRDFGLGSIGNWGSHVLDMAQWALGKDAEGPVSIAPPTAKEPHTIITYADGVRILCPRTAGDSANCSVYGTKGRKIIFGGPKIREAYDRTPLGPGDVFLYRPERNDHNGNWLSCMRTRKATICNEEVGFRSGSLVCLIAISDWLGRPLRYDPVRSVFPDDAEANRLLDAPKRSPWRIY